MPRIHVDPLPYVPRLAARWLEGAPLPATIHICKCALRTVGA